MWIRRSLACLLLTAGLSVAAAARAADDIEVEAASEGELVEVRAKATIDAPHSVVWSTLTDYESLPEFVRGMRRSKITARRGSTLIIEQSGEARFLFLAYPIDVTLEVTERPPTSVEVRALSGTLRHCRGATKSALMPAERAACCAGRAPSCPTSRFRRWSARCSCV